MNTSAVLLGQPSACMSCRGGGDPDCKPCGGCGCLQFGLLDFSDGFVPVGFYADKNQFVVIEPGTPVIECSWVYSDVLIKSAEGLQDAVDVGLVAPAALSSMSGWFVRTGSAVILRQSEGATKLSKQEAEDISRRDDSE